MDEYLPFDEFRMVFLVPAGPDEAACESVRQTLEGRPFRAEIRRAMLRIIRRHPELAQVRVQLSG
jgi:hypothetical protein